MIGYAAGEFGVYRAGRVLPAIAWITSRVRDCWLDLAGLACPLGAFLAEAVCAGGRTWR